MGGAHCTDSGERTLQERKEENLVHGLRGRWPLVKPGEVFQNSCSQRVGSGTTESWRPLGVRESRTVNVLILRCHLPFSLCCM